LENFAQGLADYIPLNDPSQIKFSNNFAIDKSIVNRRQLLLSLLISPSDNKDNQVMNVMQIVRSLDSMIKNSEVSSLSFNNYTKYLDIDYGFIMNSKLFHLMNIFFNLTILIYN